MNETNDASALFAPIWRRRWLILAVGVLVAVGTYFYYRHQHPGYSAATQVYLGAGAEEQSSITGVSGAGRKSTTLEPVAQAALINSAIIKQEVRDRLRTLRKQKGYKKAAAAALLGKVKAKATEKVAFITINVEAHSARGATLLADATAEAYVNRQNAKFRRAIEQAIALTRRQVRRIEAAQEAHSAEASAPTGKGSKSSTPVKSKGISTAEALQVATLSSKINQLEAELGIVSVRQIQTAKAIPLASSPKQNAIFGFLVGLVLASIAAYALARFDDRLRTLPEMEEAFQAEILTALPAVRRPIVYSDGTPRPSNLLREPLQRLHTTLSIGGVRQQDGGGRPQTILFLSAHGGDGQSTVVADLALTQRDTGAAVAVVEADLRRPVQARLLGVSDRPGLADVLEHRLALSEALQGVGVPAQGADHDGVDAGGHVATVVQARASGAAAVLVGGVVANPAAALADAAMPETLRALAVEYEYVLIDAPPPLEVSDMMPLLGLVDGVIIVARAGQTHAVAARRLVQLLARTPSAPLLGVVANGVSQRDIRKYGFSTYSGRSWRSRLIRR
jgi:Mrp family chromosome partitioning ATPase/capsular polysaccharide biosynthesis protein